eukprot:CAMPEP_0185781338 /NCGR_PEP_ID=MMETSP1174-20130828/102011_1 /TAXON_ID=35687 /ORGANISM="Dictyocha speculum, Strain CCMP1381" /LENGTH=312 /DNA_ID=CAMNT_0028471269 /DNA_START=212 /DNA_END=1150 /DNA_ORIENTATION=+
MPPERQSMDDVMNCMLPEDNTDQIFMETRIEDRLIAFIPIIAPLLGFLFYPEIASGFRYIIDDLLSDRSWIPVDGQVYQISILTPTIIGIVVPPLAITYGTLTSLTASTLRERQLQIREMLNQETSELRALVPFCEALFSGSAPERQRIRNNIKCYANRLISESKDGIDLKFLEYIGAGDTELAAVTQALTMLPEPNSVLIGEALQSTRQLRGFRSTRLALLQGTFPPLYWVIFGLLGTSILTCFLIETDQDTLAFLDAIQLKILFTMLVGVFTSTGTLLYDLNNPFTGAFRITPAVSQLFSFACSIEIDDD